MVNMDNTTTTILDLADGSEATGVTGKELGEDLGLTTRAANKLAQALASDGQLVNSGWCRIRGEWTESTEMKKVPGASIVWVHPNHAHFYNEA